jgi:hypothetical protein
LSATGSRQGAKAGGRHARDGNNSCSPVWMLQSLGTCEHVTPMQLLLTSAQYDASCRSLTSSRMTLAQHLESILPGSLVQPVHRYERIDHRSSVLRGHALSSRITSEMMPHLHMGDNGDPLVNEECVWGMRAGNPCYADCCVYWKYWRKNGKALFPLRYTNDGLVTIGGILPFDYDSGKRCKGPYSS